MFSKACEYGIKGCLLIAKKSLDNERVGLIEIAKEINSPEAFTAKILQQLSKSNIIKSIKGPNGGFEVEKGRMNSIKLIDIVNAIDGEGVYIKCGLGLHKCNAKKPCPVHDEFAKIRNELKQMLENKTLLELASNLDVGLTYLK